jgi:hypothetical protein
VKWDYYSRFVFDRVKHYLAVLLQPGLVILDADSNESDGIKRRRRRRRPWS